MIRQTIVPPIANTGGEESRGKFLEALSESIQGVMQPQTAKPPEGGVLDTRTLGPLVFVRYEGAAECVKLPFQPDGDMPLACDRGNGMILADEKCLLFDTSGQKTASGWCVSSGRPAGRFGQ